MAKRVIESPVPVVFKQILKKKISRLVFSLAPAELQGPKLFFRKKKTVMNLMHLRYGTPRNRKL